MAAPVRCRCPHGTSLEIESHGLAPAGWKKPGRPANGPPLADCVLCGNTGRTSVGRVRVARAAGILSALGSLATVATLVLAVAWVVGWAPPAAAGGALVAALACALVVGVVERRLARTG